MCKILRREIHNNDEDAGTGADTAAMLDDGDDFDDTASFLSFKSTVFFTAAIQLLIATACLGEQFACVLVFQYNLMLPGALKLGALFEDQWFFLSKLVAVLRSLLKPWRFTSG